MKTTCLVRTQALAGFFIGLVPALALMAADASPGGARVDALFDASTICRLNLEIPQAGLDALGRDPKSYVKAALREAGTTLAAIGVRVKGSGGFPGLARRPNLVLKFNEFDPDVLFHGHSRIALDSSRDDPTYVCKALGGIIFRTAGVPAPRIAFARLEVNGKDLGLYLIEQAVNRDFLAEYFKKTKGNLYEGSNADVNEKLDRDGGQKNQDQSDLRALAAAVEERDPEERVNQLGNVLDVPWFIAFAAAEVFAWHRNGYTLNRNNYRVYHDPVTDKMVFIAHGLDELFGRPTGALLPEWKGLVAKALLETAEGRRRYRQTMIELLHSPFRPDLLQSQLDKLARRVRPGLIHDAAGLEAFDIGVRALRGRIAERAQFLAQQLETPPRDP